MAAAVAHGPGGHVCSGGQKQRGYGTPSQRAKQAPLAGPLAVDFARGAPDGERLDPVVSRGVGAQQRAVADDIDQARDSARETADQEAGRRAEQRPFDTGDSDPVPDVVPRLPTRQRLQMVTRGNALSDLPQLVAGEQGAQFRLAHQDDLEEFLLGCFQVRQQPHLFDHVLAQVLGFVHQYYGVTALAVGSEQIVIQRIGHRLDAIAAFGRRNAKLSTDAREELAYRYAGIEDQRHVHVAWQILQHRAGDECLAGADLTGELHEAAALADAVGQMGKRLPVPRAEIEVTRVRGDGKRAFGESEITLVHKRRAPPGFGVFCVAQRRRRKAGW